jgi:hypothetical protein
MATDTSTDSIGPTPAGYLDYLAADKPIEGFVGKSYLSLWPIDQLRELNDLLETQTFATGLLVVGTNGNVEAYGIDQTREPAVFVNVPLVGGSAEFLPSRSRAISQASSVGSAAHPSPRPKTAQR